MHTCICLHLDAEVFLLATFCSDEHSTLGSTATIEDYSLSTLHEGNVLDFVRLHIITVARHTIDEIENIVGNTPHTIAVPTTYITLHVVEGVSDVVLLHEFLNIDC